MGILEIENDIMSNLTKEPKYNKFKMEVYLYVMIVLS